MVLTQRASGWSTVSNWTGAAVVVLSVLRLASLWEDEQRSKGSDTSLCSVVWSFCRTRLLLSILCLAVTQVAGFSGPVSLDQLDQHDQHDQ